MNLSEIWVLLFISNVVLSVFLWVKVRLEVGLQRTLGAMHIIA